MHPISFRGLFRGRDFAFIRLERREWSRLRCLAYMAAAPVIPLAMTLRAAGHAIRSQRLAEWVLFAPIQVVFHSAWCAGEWTVHYAHVRRGTF